MNKIKFTHYGWLGFCPAIFSEIESEAPMIEPRFKCLGWLMDASEWCIGQYLDLRCRLDSNFEPMFPLVVSGEFKKPVVREFCEGCDL